MIKESTKESIKVTIMQDDFHDDSQENKGGRWFSNNWFLKLWHEELWKMSPDARTIPIWRATSTFFVVCNNDYYLIWDVFEDIIIRLWIFMQCSCFYKHDCKTWERRRNSFHLLNIITSNCIFDIWYIFAYYVHSIHFCILKCSTNA